MARASPADFQTSKTLKDMNSDSFTRSPYNKLLWSNNGSSNTPASHNDQVTTSLSLGHAVHPPPRAQCITGSEREKKNKVHKGRSEARKSSCGQTTYHLCETVFSSSIKRLNGFELLQYNNIALASD